MAEKIVRIGGACAGLGDTPMAVTQLVQGGDVDYLIFDFLAEFTMPILARMKADNPDAGYAPDFAGPHLRPNLREIAAKGIKLVTNAGGISPHSCAAAVGRMAAEMGLNFRIAVVDGDDLQPRVEQLRAAGIQEMFSGKQIPERPITSVNAYLGALPIAAALAKGTDIVITGRVVDSALVLGPLMHEFGWAADDYDRLAAGTVLGHLLECGAQVTGGIFTDWRDVPDWANIGYPIAECHADGSAIITKSPGTGGLVSVGSVSEQLLYEIGDPQRYYVPDVTCDFSTVRIESVGPDRVLVSGATGLPPTDTYKAVMTLDNGWRGMASFPVRGIDASAKAQRVAEEVLVRTKRILRDTNRGEWRATNIEILGGEASYGARARYADAREVVCRLVVEHEDRDAVGMMLREQGTGCISMAPGHVGMTLGAVVSPVSEVFLFLIGKDQVETRVTVDGVTEILDVPLRGGFRQNLVPSPPAPPPLPNGKAERMVPLVKLAWVRNGDKGNHANVAVIARRPDYLPYLASVLTADAVAAWYAHMFEGGQAGKVDRFFLPGSSSFNFMLYDSLGGGCTGSLRFDPLGKSVAQEILEFPIPIPATLAVAGA